ncbi:MAG: preprotein translocase subunit SecE [Bacillota bacterium]|jgi:preprotein translocase subunit SecE|nr:preprotein translocase subunit SecE [Candidatus Fermentithermobacillaceae bacterium]
MKILQGIRRFFLRIVKFLGEVRGEIKKVIWPSAAQLRVYTMAVLAAMVGIGVILWGTDALLTLVVGFLTKR